MQYLNESDLGQSMYFYSFRVGSIELLFLWVWLLKKNKVMKATNEATSLQI